jgi:Fe-S oxidoreductase
LWPDTFSNHFFPETARSAVRVLEAAGYRVDVPARSLCCGRPLYDFGMLSLAKRQLRQVLDALAPQLEQGTPIVGLEPSCVAVFRDELTNLFPTDENARRLSRQALLLSEFLDKETPDFKLPKIDRKAIVHGHCHHKAVMGLDHEKNVLDRLGLDHRILDSGCCGMAGSFGFEAEKYDVSVACAERILLPQVRRAAADTLVVANGFSCRSQIEELSGRRPLHLAEVLAMAKGDGR